MINILRVFLIALLLPLAAGAQSTTATAVFDTEAFEKLSVRAQEVIDKEQASTEALELLRAQLSKYRSAALNQKAVSAQKVAPINERLQVLGAAPADGETEEADVAALRADLNAQIKRARGPVLEAEERYQRVNGQIEAIDTLIRERNRRELLTRQPSPLVPSQVWSTSSAVVKFGGEIQTEVVSNWNNASRKTARWQNLPLAAIMFGLAVLLLVRSRVWARRVQEMTTKGQRARIAATMRFVGSFAQLFFPALGLFFLERGINQTELLGLRGGFLAQAILTAAFIMFFVSWLSRSLFIPSGDQPAFIELSAEELPLVRRSLTMVGVFFGAKEIVDAMSLGKSISVDEYDVILFPLVCIGSYALWRVGRVMVTRSKAFLEKTETGQMAGRFSLVIGNLVRAAAVLAPILGALGYSLAGQTLMSSTALSLLLIGGFYVVFRFFKTITGDVGSMVVAAGSEEDRTRYGALFQVALGFAFVCAAIPLLALIWGVRLTELLEIWLWMRDGVSIGDTRISFTDFLTFVLIFSIGYSATRLLQTTLRTSVLPNTRIDSGGQNAIVTGTGYVGIFLAAIVAISATGLDLSNLAIVAGALSVGIGFGLQTIVSNFVSGIILLIERPIKAGDWIEVGTYSGYVRKISVRSTEVETFDRASVVIPNADLIAGTVTNWTHSSMAGRVRVPVGVAYGSDPRHVEKVLMKVAESHPMVLLDPGPSVMFMGFGADSMDFEIRAILRDVNWMLSAKSDLNFEIVKRFREEGIEIPFAQRDVTIKNFDALGEALNKGKET